ncbi:MAG: aldo/keto reductase [Alphaproteobacteria bacterium]|nr:aldo/keto reductase [Alphaproteobacteria bacterium]
MDYRQLGKTDIKVSEICLGTMTWGRQTPQAEAFEQMDYATAQGVNFFDTAELYPIPPEAETQGATETIIGNWFKQTGKRGDVILGTKVTGRSSHTWFRKDGSPTEFTPAQINEAIDESLRRLQTDYIDLYQLHWPDRPINLFGGLGYQHGGEEINRIEDTLAVLQKLIEAGKVRQIGISNETPWGIMKFLHFAETKNLPPIVSVQNPYNFLNRIYEIGGAEIYHREQIGLLAYSPLAGGYLTGKYQKGAIPEGSRKHMARRMGRYETAGAEQAIDAYLAIAEKHGLNPAHMASRFVTTRDFVTSNIIGATNLEQLKIALAANELTLTDALLAEIDEVHLRAANLCP